MKPYLRPGFTFVEVTIALVLVTAIIGTVMYVLITGGETVNDGTILAYVNAQANYAIDAMNDDITECRVIKAPDEYNNYMGISIQVPIPKAYSPISDTISEDCFYPISGTPAGNTVRWCSYKMPTIWEDDTNSKIANFTYRVVPKPFILFDATTGRETITYVLNEQKAGQDYNRDGTIDVDDSFYVGDLIKEIYDDNGAVALSTTLLQNVLLPVPYYDPVQNVTVYDINNDYEKTTGRNSRDDCIFTLLDKNGDITTNIAFAKRLRINIWTVGMIFSGYRETESSMSVVLPSLPAQLIAPIQSPLPYVDSQQTSIITNNQKNIMLMNPQQ